MVCGLCETSERFVRLSPHKGSQATIAHPLRLGPGDWKPILGSVHLQIRTQPFYFTSHKGPETPAFLPEEVEYLSETLSKTFAQAQPDEWVVFGLSQLSPTGVTEMTTGGWYVEGTQLHLLLANYRAAVSMLNIREYLGRDPLYQLVGATLYDFSPGAYSRKSRESNSILSTLKSEVPHLVIDYQPLLAGVPTPSNAPSKKGEETGSTAQSSTSPAPPLSIEERLKSLKRMHEQGLISEEDYQEKKKQLLERL